MSDFRYTCAQDTGEYPDAWIPVPGAVLIGAVVEYGEGSAAFGKTPTVIVADEQSGEMVSVWLFSTVLLSQFQVWKPRIGERIGIKYFGKDPDKGYHRFRLRVDRPAQLPAFLQASTPDSGADVSDMAPETDMPF